MQELDALRSLVLVAVMSLTGFAGELMAKSTKRKKVIYRKYTELNFEGETVQGKVRTPELFYIFQRNQQWNSIPFYLLMGYQ